MLFAFDGSGFLSCRCWAQTLLRPLEQLARVRRAAGGDSLVLILIPSVYIYIYILCIYSCGQVVAYAARHQAGGSYLRGKAGIPRGFFFSVTYVVAQESYADSFLCCCLRGNAGILRGFLTLLLPTW